jgi:hypothetical protein
MLINSEGGENMAHLSPSSLVIFARLIGAELGRTEDGLKTISGFQSDPGREVTDIEKADLAKMIVEGESYKAEILQAIEDLKSFVQQKDGKLIPAIVEGAKRQVEQLIKGAIPDGFSKN